LPDLDAYEIPWIELMDATMKWCIHAIIFQASVEVVTCLSGGPKGEEADANMQVHASCDVGVI
jgi:hypothetical protein